MEIAVGILVGVMVGFCALVAYMTVQGIGLDNIRFRRDITKTADQLDKTEQQVDDKKRATEDILKNRIPEIAQKHTQESTRTDDLNREITQSQNSVNSAGHTWDAQVTALEQAGKLAGDRIVDLDAFTDSQLRFLEDHGYRRQDPGESPSSSEPAADRPVNPVREREKLTVRSGSDQRRKEVEMAASLHQEVGSAIPPPAARDNLPELTPLRQRVGGALQRAVRRRSRRDQNNGAASPRTRGGTPQPPRKGKGS